MVRAYVVNMDRSRDRMARMARQLASLGLEYERVRAVDGERLPASFAGPTPATLGCGLSHREVWRRVAALDEPALVLEDDAVLVPDFRARLADALAACPRDFDVLVLGCFFMCHPRREYPLGVWAMRPFVPRRDDARTWRSGRATVFVPERFAGTHCYVLSPGGARRLLRLLPRPAWHVDQEMNHPGVRLYAAWPPLASQADMHASTIARFEFPGAAHALLAGVTDRTGVPLSYYAWAPAFQVLGQPVNSWAFAALAAGLLAPGSARWLAPLAALDVAAFGARGVTAPAGAFALGLAVRLAVAGR